MFTAVPDTAGPDTAVPDTAVPGRAVPSQLFQAYAEDRWEHVPQDRSITIRYL